MIHHHECLRCTHTWCTSCMGAMFVKPEDRERDNKQGWSNLCWDCFEKLEKGEIRGLELYELYWYLHTKSNNYGGRPGGMFHTVKAKYSGMTKEYISGWSKDYSTYDETLSNYVSGQTAEETELNKIVHEVLTVFKTVILEQATPKRLELNQLQKEHTEQNGGKWSPIDFWNGGWRPEGFEGDPAGESRPEILFGLDLASGTLDITAPRIEMNDGTQSCVISSKGAEYEEPLDTPENIQERFS